MQIFIYASIVKTLPDLSPGACFWQKPRLPARWEVMSRCAPEPALMGLFSVETVQGLMPLAVLDPGLLWEEPQHWWLLLPVTCLSVSPLEAAL